MKTRLRVVASDAVPGSKSARGPRAAPAHAGMAPVLASASAAATFLLVVYHVRYLLFSSYATVASGSLALSAFYFVSGLGHQAFAMYFVTHGYLFARSIAKRQGARDYAAFIANKLARTYAVLLPVLALGLVLDLAGSRYLNGAGLYTAFPDFSVVTLDARTLLGQLFVAEPFLVPTFGSNGVLWVFAYEWWFCCLFLLLAYLLDRWRWLGVAACVGAVLGLVRLFPAPYVAWLLIWLVGAAVLLCGASARVVPLRLALPVFVAALTVSRYMESRVALLDGADALRFSFIKDMSFALGFGLVLLALQGRAGRTKHARSPPGRLVATANRFSYSLFFGHFPVMMFIVAAATRLFGLPLKHAPDVVTVLAFVLVTLAMYAAGWGVYLVSERHGPALARMLLRRIRGRPPLQEGP